MKLALILIITLILFGCQGTSHCLRIEGGSQKYGIENGAIEYCFDKKLSQEEEAAVLKSGGDKYFVVHEKYISRANEIISSEISNKVKTKSMQYFITNLEEKK